MSSHGSSGKSCSTVDGTSLRGQFRILAEARNGRTVLAERAVSAPFHLSKPYWTGRALMVQAVQATAGVFAGDRMDVTIGVGRNAVVLFTAPSASRIHTMPAGWAEMEQIVAVEAGGWLDIRPELFIPQAGCRYRQRTRIDVAEGGALFFAEMLAPGRTARGECFAFEEVQWALDLTCVGRLVARERYSLRGADESVWALRHPFPAAYYAGCYLVTPSASEVEPLQAALHAAESDRCLIGATRLDEACWSFKLLAADSVALRTGLARLRARLAARFPLLAEEDYKL